MFALPWSRHPALATHSRLLPLLPAKQAAFAWWELASLIGCGIGAVVAAQYLKIPLKQMPGHAILQAMLPLALGLAIVPRHGAGNVMGLSAVCTALVMRATGALSMGFGGVTSSCLAGFFLDFVLWAVRSGWLLYLGFALAGLASNLVAMAARGGAKRAGLDDLTDRPFASWITQAAFTYPFFGILAGLICATLFFSLRRRNKS
jgi:hypothetical protein